MAYLDWIAQHHIALTHKSRLAEQTRLWLNDNKSTAFLLAPGKPLVEANVLAETGSIPLSAEELALISCSRAQVSRKRWRRRLTLVSLACLTLVSFVAMLSSKQSQSLAERKRLEAEDLMGFMIGDFADKLRSVRRMDLLEGISQQALSYVQTAQQQPDNGLLSLTMPPPSFALRLQHAKSLQAVAEVRYYRDDANEANTYYQDAELRLTELLEEAPDNVDVLKAAGLNAFWLGQLAYDEKDYKKAKKGFAHYQILSEKLVQLLPNDKDAKLELAYALSSLGSVHLKLMEFNEALSNFKKSITLTDTLHKVLDGIAVSYSAENYTWVASTYLHLGAQSKALDNLSIALEKLNAYSEYADIKTNLDESSMYIFILKAEILALLEQRKKALEQLNEAELLVESLLQQDSNNSIWIKEKTTISISIIKLLSENQVLEDEQGLKLQLDTLSETLDPESAFSDFVHSIMAYQNLQMWEKSATLLEDAKKTRWVKAFTATNTSPAISETLTFSEYLVSVSRQDRFNDSTSSQTCSKLQDLTALSLEKSSHPILKLANLFSQICMYKKSDFNEHQVEIRSLSTQQPSYFSTFIRDL